MRRTRPEGVGSREKFLIILTFVSIIVAFSSLAYREESPDAGSMENAGIKELSTEGFVQVRAVADVINGSGVMGLSAGCYRLAAGTDPFQADSIKKAINSETGPRPNTHELMRDAFQSLGVELVMVKVTQLKGENFIGKMLVKQGDTLLNLDAKPSDGVALALRMDAPIYFNETLLKERGQNTCDGKNQTRSS